MATYKVIQDIEAEDKLLWQLSFRQFIYALVACFMLYMSYLSYSKGAAFILIFTLPIAAFAAFLAFPFGKDQPTEVWALAKLRFLFKPRKRIWAQSGVKELVTINVPKRIEIERTDGLSQYEVKSRLSALANTIDSRGWAIKNATSGVYQSPLHNVNDDRLISTSSLPQAVPDYIVDDAEDVMDVSSNPIAHQMDELLSAKNSLRHQQLLETLSRAKVETDEPPKSENTQIQTQPIITTPLVNPTNNPQPLGPVSIDNPVVQQIEPQIDDPSLSSALRGLNESQHTSLNNMRVLNPIVSKTTPKIVNNNTPLDQNQPQSKTNPAPTKPSTEMTDPVILNLANRNDLNVTVIAHEANRAKASKKSSDGEVLISLH